MRRAIVLTLAPYRPASCVRMGTGLLAVLVLASCSGDASDPTAPDGDAQNLRPAVSAIVPEMLVEGASIVIQGSDFSPNPSDNVVTVDGVTAMVTAATSRQLTVTVPAFECRPQRTANVQVRVGSHASNRVTATIRPADFVDAPVGEIVIWDDPRDFCLQFPPAPAGAGEYLVGIGTAAERPTEMLEVSMTGAEGQVAPATLTASRAGAAAREPRSLPAPASERGFSWEGQFRLEQRVRDWERQNLDVLYASRLGAGIDTNPARVGVPRAVPSVGDQLEIKVPNFDDTSGTVAGVCEPTTITSVVRVVGQRGIFVTDVANPQADPLTDADLQELSDAFDSLIYDVATRYFGEPVDQDGNERIVVAFTIEVNKVAGGEGAGVAFLGDFFLSPGQCAASDAAELYYAAVPDPTNVAGTKARTKSDVTDKFTKVLAHEFAHMLQYSTRRRLGGLPLSGWEAEGQAVLAQEVVGHAVLGLASGQNYGSATVTSDAGAYWYAGRFEDVAAYLGHASSGGGAARGPESCSLFLFSLVSQGNCPVGAGYGAAWSFFRFVADRYGPAWPGGEAGFLQSWNSAHPDLIGTANAEAVLGRAFSGVFAEWAAMHYVDDRVAGADPALLLSSWSLQDVLTSVDADAPLQPPVRSFKGLSTTASIRGGSTAYTLLTDASARPATAIRVRDGSDAALGSDMRPILWVVRTR